MRNGSISGFGLGVNLQGDGSIVEGLRVSGGPGSSLLGIAASGIVRGNTVVRIASHPEGIGISATGIVTGNFVSLIRTFGIQVGQGSTVIGNTSTFSDDGGAGIFVDCPSNVTDNTAVNNPTNLELRGTGCTNTNNVAP